MKICIYDIYFIVIFIILSIILYKLFYEKKENFDATSDTKALINQIYNTDIEAIRNLSNIASKLIAGGVTIPGNATITGNTNIAGTLKVGSWTIRDHPNGHLQFIQDGVDYNENYNAIQADRGFCAFGSGDIWMNRANRASRGWISDTKLNRSGDFMTGPLYMSDKPIYLRNNGDNAHYIVYSSSTDGPEIRGNNGIQISSPLYMYDKPIYFRGSGDTAHYIVYSSSTDGPEIRGNSAIKILSPLHMTNQLVMNENSICLKEYNNWSYYIRYNHINADELASNSLVTNSLVTSEINIDDWKIINHATDHEGSLHFRKKKGQYVALLGDRSQVYADFNVF